MPFVAFLEPSALKRMMLLYSPVLPMVGEIMKMDISPIIMPYSMQSASRKYHDLKDLQKSDGLRLVPCVSGTY